MKRPRSYCSYGRTLSSFFLAAFFSVESLGHTRAHGAVLEDWAVMYKGIGGGRDVPHAMTTDREGNVYVAGQDGSNNGIVWDGSDPENTSDDFATVKYNSRGEVLWTARYDGGGLERATGVAVDISGNVYVTGLSGTAAWTLGISTLKYDRNGTEIWARRFVLDTRYGAWPEDICVDLAGNVYVTAIYKQDVGWSGSAYVTVKYDPDGVQLWSVRNQFALNHFTQEPAGRMLTVDAAGNVYVAGAYLHKYDSLGKLLWEAGGNGDGGAAVALDGSGNAYVSAFTTPNIHVPDSGGIKTTKYDSAGRILWQRNYGSCEAVRGSTSISVDTNDGIYVTGERQTSGIPEGVALKYDSNGNLLWEAHHTLVADIVLALDAAGNPCIAGTAQKAEINPSIHIRATESFLTVKYTPAGIPLWERRYVKRIGTVRAMTSGSSGEIYVLGYGYGDYVTIAYGAQGDSMWVASYDGPEWGSGRGTALAPDAEGNVYVTGTGGIPGGSAQTTIKYDSAGQLVWMRTHVPTNSYGGIGKDIAIDASGCIYVAGSAFFYNEDHDATIVKYNPEGEALWSARYDSGGYDGLSDLEVDSAGNAYVVGSSYGGVNNGGVAAKYDRNGNFVWAVSVEEGPTALTVDAAGNVYATGQRTGKYDPSGREIWSRPSYAVDIAVDSGGNVYIANSDAAFELGETVKLSPDGTEVWRHSWPHGGWPNKLVLDSVGNLLVTGVVPLWDYLYTGHTVKYSADGALLWEVSGEVAWSTAIAVDAVDNVYVTGQATTKYDHKGIFIWSHSAPNFAFTQENAVDARGNVYVTGSASFAGSQSKFWTAKHVQFPTLTITREPSASELIISWDGPATDFVLERCSALGNSSWTQVPPPYQTNISRISITEALPSGNKFYRLSKPPQAEP